MPPGTREESFGNVSMTNISVILNEDGQKVITTYTIPTRNLSISRHDLILANAREGLDVETIDINHSERPDLVRSSHPLRINRRR